jgi:hypothetical protein
MCMYTHTHVWTDCLLRISLIGLSVLRGQIKILSNCRKKEMRRLKNRNKLLHSVENVFTSTLMPSVGPFYF